MQLERLNAAWLEQLLPAKYIRISELEILPVDAKDFVATWENTIAASKVYEKRTSEH